MSRSPRSAALRNISRTATSARSPRKYPSGYTSHVGLIVRLNDRAYFTHATSDRDKGRMVVIDRPITDYVNGASKHAGIIICRPNDVPQSPLWQNNVARQ